MGKHLPCPPADARFWAKVRKEPGGCWVWTGATRNGYGRLARKVDGRLRWYQASRVAYEDAHGLIPPDLELDHIRDVCGNVACVKAVADESGPAHLEPVTHLVNVRRGDKIVEACPLGHPYDEANTYRIPATGGRMCRTCKAAGRAGEKQRARDRRRQGLAAGRPGRPRRAST